MENDKEHGEKPADPGHPTPKPDPNPPGNPSGPGKPPVKPDPGPKNPPKPDKDRQVG
jgi:hypothetical protein